MNTILELPKQRSTRYTDSQELREYMLISGYKLQGLIDVLIKMWLSGEVSSDKVMDHYYNRHKDIVKTATETLLKNRYNK